MRIIGGQSGGRKLCGPEKSRGRKALIRPTSDRARESLFNILGDSVVDAYVVDFFAGTGALGLEALSRGAQHVLFVDSYQKALELIHKNTNLCGFNERVTIVKRDLRSSFSFLQQYLPSQGADLFFLDPPYRKQFNEQILAKLVQSDFLHRETIVVAEDAFDAGLPDRIGTLSLVEQRRYGDTAFWIYKVE